MADGFGNWYVALKMWGYQVCSNNDLRLTYLTSRSNLLPNAFKHKKRKVVFWKTVEAKVIILFKSFVIFEVLHMCTTLYFFDHMII